MRLKYAKFLCSLRGEKKQKKKKSKRKKKQEKNKNKGKEGPKA